ncbi:hypothetical protein Tco_0111066 [Tanacetum coccineum]
MILGSLKKFKKRSPKDLKPREQDTRRTSGNTTRNDPFPPFLIIEAQTQVIEQYTARSGMDMKMAKTCYHSHFNDVKQINATVDSKAVVVTEASIRSSLLFNDVDGTACLTNESIFQNLALIGYEGDFNKLTFQKAPFSPQWKFLIHTILHCLSSKSTSWNEFSTNIALAVICLATNQKFNFSKLIFDGMLRNLDNTKKKFLMYPRFLMVFLNNQIELGEPFNDVYPTPAHNLKVFTNMSRKGLKFSRKITPLFPNMLTHAAEGEGSGEPTEPQPTPSPTQPSTGDQPPETSSSHATTQDSRDSLEGTNRNEGDQVQIPHDSPLSGGHTSDRAEGALNLQELSVLCTNLSNRVLALESIKDAQAAEISALKSRIKKLEKKCKPCISHHRAWLKSVNRLYIKKRFGKKESIMVWSTWKAVDKGRQSGETEEVKLTDDTKVIGNYVFLVSTVSDDYPHRALKNKGIVDSGCSRHMTGNKAYLAEFQDFNGGPVTFRGSKGYITGKAVTELLLSGCETVTDLALSSTSTNDQ